MIKTGHVTQKVEQWVARMKRSAIRDVRYTYPRISLVPYGLRVGVGPAGV